VKKCHVFAIGAAAAALAIPAVMLAPGRAPRSQKAPFMGLNCAHRGLHSKDKSVPENSLEAFRLAAEAGYGIELDELERRSEKLLHSKSGAALAKYIFGQDEEVFQAILYHTTGCSDMSLAQKILYLADYMEPNRDFPEVDEMRTLAYEDLDKCLLRGLTIAVEDLSRKGMVLHPNSVRARDYLKGKSL